MDSYEEKLSDAGEKVLAAFNELSQDDKEELMQCHFMELTGWYTLDNRLDARNTKYDIHRGIYHMDAQTIIDKKTVDTMTAIHNMLVSQTMGMSYDGGCQRTRLILWRKKPDGKAPACHPTDVEQVEKALRECYRGPKQFTHVQVWYYEGENLEKITMSILVHHYVEHRQKLIDAGYDVSDVDKAYDYYSH